MIDRPRSAGWRGRKGWAWLLAAAALVAMTVGMFLPSYGVWMGVGPASLAGQDGPDLQGYPGWECAWTVVWIWENVLNDGFGDLSYGESLMLTYFPINLLFLAAPWFLWLTGRTRRLGWGFRVVYTLIVAQVLAWWLSLVWNPDNGAVLIGYWFWLASYVLMAAAFWVIPRGGMRTEGRARG